VADDIPKAMEREQGPSPNWRVRGRVLVAVGLFLVLLMAAIAWNLAPIMLRPGVEVDGSRFAGTAAQGQIFLGLFALVGLFGAMSVANGAWMMATGRRSPTGTRLGMILFLALFALGLAIRRGLV
jgi:polyferredoxin